MSDSLATLLAAFIGMAAVIAAAAGSWLGARSVERNRRRGDQLASALTELFAAYAKNAVFRGAVAPEDRDAEQFRMRLAESYAEFTSAKARVLMYGGNEVVQHLLDADKRGFAGNDVQARASVTAMVNAARADTGLDAMSKDHVAQLLFGGENF